MRSIRSSAPLSCHSLTRRPLLFARHASPVMATFQSRLTSALVLGIRAETKIRWERRVPLVPETVQKLVKHDGVTVLCEPSTRRAFTDEEYTKAGAIITKDLKKADVIVGVKEVAIEDMLANKTYLYFSHTHKGQEHNIRSLKALLAKNIRLIDYELITDDQGQRAVLFGKYAGYAGAFEMLRGFGDRMLALGYNTPFLYVSAAHGYPDLNAGIANLKTVGSYIKKHGTGIPKSVGPLVIGISGGGAVAAGARYVLEGFGDALKWVRPRELSALQSSFSTHQVYATQLLPEDLFQNRDGKTAFDLDDYFTRGLKAYKSVFAAQYAPHLNMFLNGVLWTPDYPKTLTLDEAKALVQQNIATSLSCKLTTIADVICDVPGGIELTTHATTIDQPCYIYDPITEEESQSPYAPGIQMMTVDNLPAELAKDASQQFSHSLYPFVQDIVRKRPSAAIQRATLLSGGELQERFAHLHDVIAAHDLQRPQNVLLLGAGMVAAPCADYFLNQNRKDDVKYHVAIGGLVPEDGMRIIGPQRLNRGDASVVEVDASQSKVLAETLKSGKYDIVISLVPAALHVSVAKACLDAAVPLVTASYTSPEMLALDQEAIAKNIPLLNELGLDPGIDHLTAKRIIDEVHDSKGSITHFQSWCGGLPSPEDSGATGGLAYKFSWSPRGVLSAAGNASRWIEAGEVRSIEKGHLLAEGPRKLDMFAGFRTEGYPNRDSTHYIKLYGLEKEKVKTMVRGTIRFEGWCQKMFWLYKMGLMQDRHLEATDETWGDIIRAYLGLASGTGPQGAALLDDVAEALQIDGKQDQAALRALFDFFKFETSSPIKYALPGKAKTAIIDAFSGLLADKLKYQIHERDLVILQHTFEASWPNGDKKRYTSGMVAYGEPTGTVIEQACAWTEGATYPRDSYTAMGKTVGVPAAAGAELILEARRGMHPELKDLKGVLAPMHRSLYTPLLVKLEAQGITFKETKEKL